MHSLVEIELVRKIKRIFGKNSQGEVPGLRLDWGPDRANESKRLIC